MEQILICDCHSAEHQLLFRKVGEDPEVYIDILLNKHSFFKRLIYGIKYIFGYRCKYGMFEEIVTSKEKLQSIIDKL